jgi:hypothetical protein
MIKKSADPFKPKKMTNREIQLALIENFTNMQRVLTNLTIKFDNLSDNLSRLLQLFEVSAKNFMDKQIGTAPEDADTLRKLDVLLDQNKTIAKGLTLIEEKIKHRIYPDISNNSNNLIGKPRPLIKS